MSVLKTSDDGTLHYITLGLLGFWTLSIVSY